MEKLKALMRVDAKQMTVGEIINLAGIVRRCTSWDSHIVETDMESISKLSRKYLMEWVKVDAHQ